MLKIDADGFRFTYPDSWKAAKYDDWAFYQNQFKKMNDGIKAVDIVAFDEQKTLWLIEVKDFRQHKREKGMPLHEEIWKKVYDTLAGLFAAKCNAVNEEKTFAQTAVTARKIRVVFFIEQPAQQSRLFPIQLNSTDISQKLKKMTKPIDPHPEVVDSNTLSRIMLHWSVSCP